MIPAHRTSQHAVLGYGGAVAAGGPLSATAGLDVLRDGGNAVDAVIAAAFVQSVVELPWGGIGGDAFVLVRTPDGEVLALNGSGAAPVKLGTRASDGETIPRFGPLSVTVPGFVAAIERLHGHCGRHPLDALIAPSIEYAATGFPMSAEFARAAERVARGLDHDSPLLALLEGNGRTAGSRFRQPALADTLRSIASGGAAAFYGPVGEAISAALGGRGGALSPDDFEAHEAAWTRPMSAPYRDVVVHTNPPVSMGCVLLHELALYDRLGVPYRDPSDPGRIDAMVRCKHVAFARTMAMLADPHRRDPDIAGIADLERELLDPELLDQLALGTLDAPLDQLVGWVPPADGSDTTCVVATDGEGYAAAVIHSLFNEFGSRALDPATGVLLNDRLANQTVAHDGQRGIAPGGRPAHTLNAVLIERDRRPVMLLATPGGRGQVQSSFQVIVNAIDGGADPQEAIDAPRWLSGAPRRPQPNDELYFEAGTDPALIEALGRLGHRAVVTDDTSADLFGSCVAVGEVGGDAALYAAADHRREARAATY